MKNKILLIFALSISTIITAQENTNRLNRQLTITAGINATSFRNKSISEDKYKLTDKKQGINFGIVYTKYYNDWIGVSVGLNYSTYCFGLILLKNSCDKICLFSSCHI